MENKLLLLFIIIIINIGFLNTNFLHKTSLRHLGHVWPLMEMKGLKTGEKRRSAPYSSWILCGACAEILEQSMWARNRFGRELSYRPPAYVAWRRAGTTTLFLVPKYCSKIPALVNSYLSERWRRAGTTTLFLLGS